MTRDYVCRINCETTCQILKQKKKVDVHVLRNVEVF